MTFQERGGKFKMAENFEFQFIKGRTFKGFQSDEVKNLLLKWGMQGQTMVQMFSFNKLFQQYQKNDFVLDFFKDAQVQLNIQILSSSGSWTSLGTVNVDKVEVETVACTVTNMTFFDRLFTTGLVRESGDIVKCFDEFVEGFTISDELRKMHLMEESDYYDVFTQEEKDEFIFRIFRHLCLGGDICQFEDKVQPYLNTTKVIYKDLISVHKDSNTKVLQTGSYVLKIFALNSDGEMVYPPGDKHEQTFAYLIIDPVKRHVFVWYHQWRGIAW